MYFHMYLFSRCLRMLIDAILVSTNTRTHTLSPSLSLRCLALPSSIYKALRRRNLDQSKYTFLRIQFSHFKGSTSTKRVKHSPNYFSIFFRYETTLRDEGLNIFKHSRFVSLDRFRIIDKNIYRCITLHFY